MKKSILIIGVGGSGKSTLVEELKNHGYKAYDLENINGLFCMIHKTTKKIYKKYNNDDLESVKQGDWICNKKKLERLIKMNSKGTVFYCGVSSNLDELRPLFDKIFLLRINFKTLCKRLSARPVGDFGRTSGVQKWILSWKDWWENDMCKKGAIPINANRNLQKIARDIIKKAKQ